MNMPRVPRDLCDNPHTGNWLRSVSLRMIRPTSQLRVRRFLRPEGGCGMAVFVQLDRISPTQVCSSLKEISKTASARISTWCSEISVLFFDIRFLPQITCRISAFHQHGADVLLDVAKVAKSGNLSRHVLACESSQVIPGHPLPSIVGFGPERPQVWIFGEFWRHVEFAKPNRREDKD